MRSLDHVKIACGHIGDFMLFSGSLVAVALNLAGRVFAVYGLFALAVIFWGPDVSAAPEILAWARSSYERHLQMAANLAVVCLGVEMFVLGRSTLPFRLPCRWKNAATKAATRLATILDAVLRRAFSSDIR